MSATRLQVVHRTTYLYGDPVATSHHEARLGPRQSEHQQVIAHDLSISPTPATRRRRFDYFGNRVVHFSLGEPHRSLEVLAQSVVELRPPSLPDLALTPPWEAVRDRLRGDRRRDVLDAYQLTFESGHVPRLAAFAEYAAASFPAGRPVLEGVRDLTARIHADFAYDPGATDVNTPVADVLQRRRGVCQDFAHVMIGCLRALGLAARYVSGYLRTHPPPGRPRLVGADASHAWVATWVPDHGWVDFDPTNDLLPSDEHVTVAFGRDFGDVAPVRGVILGGGAHTVEVSVDVQPIGA